MKLFPDRGQPVPIRLADDAVLAELAKISNHDNTRDYVALVAVNECTLVNGAEISGCSRKIDM